MKKLKNSGFTLIELLAVITIMGILMMVAIPAVSRTIENSRRDTYSTIIHDYITAVRNAYLGDNLKCRQGDKWVVASATPIGEYYVPICTSASLCTNIGGTTVTAEDGSTSTTTPLLNGNQIEQSTKDLLESGGKSSFGNADIQGYIKIIKTTGFYNSDGDECTTVLETEADKDNKCHRSKVSSNTKMEYYALIIDSGYHGVSNETLETDIERATIETNIATTTTLINAPTAGGIPCRVA